MKSYVFNVELEQEEDGTWSAVVPSLPGCAASGDTADEAIEFLRGDTEAYVEVLLEDGRPIPLDEVVSGSEGVVIAVTPMDIHSKAS